MVEEVFNNAIDCLSDEDKKLPQVREDWIGGAACHLFSVTFEAMGYE